MNNLPFTLLKESPETRARAGTFTTLHGEVTTPVFMPVGTQAAVRSQTFDDLKESGAQIILGNTYHLLLRPGIEIFKQFGGLHGFTGWDKPILTDSGGFQIFSLSASRKISEEGAKFRSYIDGQSFVLTPELSIEAQVAMGSDIMMVLDECIESPATETQVIDAMNRTHRWAIRSLNARGDSRQALFAIVQGGCYPKYRTQSADFLTQHNFDGFAIGGLAVGESRQEREDMTAVVTDLLPKDRPRYLMGVGTPIDLLEAVHRGVDMFDCILPTAFSEQGVAYTSNGKLDLRRGIYKTSKDPLDKTCGCKICNKFSKGYLHHLIKARQYIGWQYIGYHNLWFYHNLVAQMRTHILGGTFAKFYSEIRSSLTIADPDAPVTHPKKGREKPMSIGGFEICESVSAAVAENGRRYFTIKDTKSGEIMHPVKNPADESLKVYVEQSGVIAKLKEGKPVSVWDVGLGAAFNAMTLIKEAEKILDVVPGAELNLTSFENNLDPLRLVLSNKRFFEHVKHPALGSILERGEWASKKYRMSWKLINGDFPDSAKDLIPPDIIMFDPWSHKTSPEMWDEKVFGFLAEKTGENGVTLVTYSRSKVIRSKLESQGFEIKSGVPSGVKEETTVAILKRS